MKKFLLIERQNGGCDYTIGCGIRTSVILANNVSEAKEKIYNQIGSSWHGKYEDYISNVNLYEISKEITDIEEYLNNKKEERLIAEKIEANKKQDELERIEFERLKRKFSK